MENFYMYQQRRYQPCTGSILWLLVFFYFPVAGFAQAGKIDSIKQQLLTLDDSARVDALNHLSALFISAEQKDSAQGYAVRASKEASQLRYAHGMAVYYCNLAQMAKHFDDDFRKAEQDAKTSLDWYERTNNKEGIIQAYFYAQYATFAQSKFEEALAFAQKRYAFSKQTGNTTGMVDALGAIFAIYRQSGDYEKSFHFAQQVYELAKQSNNKFALVDALYSFAQLYELIEEYSISQHYFRLVLQMDDDETRAERIATDNDIWFKMEFTETFSHLRQFDSAWRYYNRYKPTNPVYLRVWWISTGECYLLQKDYPHALQHLQLGLAEHRKLNDRNEIMRALLDIGNTYLSVGNNKAALAYGREGLQLALETKAHQYTRDGYQILSTVFERLHQTDSANHYFKRYMTMKEQVLSDLAKGRLAAYQYEQKIALANKELEVREAQLSNENFVKKVLIGGIAFLLLFGAIVVRNISLKRRNEKLRLEHQLKMQELESEQTKSQLQQQATELEVQALRAQMNPHFIFNSLNSINCFILENDKRKASEYLTKFSRLVRLILNNSQADLIPLQRELDALTLYLQLEALRFSHHFDFSIDLDADVNPSLLRVPPLLIQPYVENAVWHGLMHKKEQGKLSVTISQQKESLFCRIADNGVGRKKAAEVERKSATYRSLGMRITADRIAMLQHQKQWENLVTVNDLVLPDGSPGGTEVILQLPLIYDEGDFD